MKNDQIQGHGVKSNHEIHLRQLLNVRLNRRYIIAVLVTVLAAVAIIYALILAPIYIAFFGSLLGAVVGVMILFLCVGTRSAVKIAAANNRDYQTSPTKISTSLADRGNLLTPEELDALSKISSGSYQ